MQVNSKFKWICFGIKYINKLAQSSYKGQKDLCFYNGMTCVCKVMLQRKILSVLIKNGSRWPSFSLADLTCPFPARIKATLIFPRMQYGSLCIFQLILMHLLPFHMKITVSFPFFPQTIWPYCKIASGKTCQQAGRQMSRRTTQDPGVGRGCLCTVGCLQSEQQGWESLWCLTQGRSWVFPKWCGGERRQQAPLRSVKPGLKEADNIEKEFLGEGKR